MKKNKKRKAREHFKKILERERGTKIIQERQK